MQIYGKEIKDECSKCGEVLQCELFLQGHGIKRDRENVTEMVKKYLFKYRFQQVCNKLKEFFRKW